MGVPGLYADNATEFPDRLDAAMAMDGPVLIELNVHNMVPIQGVVPAPGRGAATDAK